MPTRVFLDWSAPLLLQVADRLLPTQVSGPLSFEGTLVVVPTKQAGRRLREHLARELPGRGGTALLDLEVRTPSSFLLGPEPRADAFDLLEAWQTCLTGRSSVEYPTLLPLQDSPLTPAQAVKLGRRLQSLREELVDADLGFTEVALRFPDNPDQTRWEELSRIERAFLRALATCGREDPCLHKRRQAAHAPPPPRVQRIIVAGVPDPPQIVLTALQRLDATLRIELWIHAPETEASAFDPWGRPLDVWGQREINGWSGALGELRQTASPDHACSLLASEIAETHRDRERPHLALGLLDETWAPVLDKQLAVHELRAYHPASRPLRETPAFRLIETLSRLSREQGVSELKRLLRQPEFLNWLGRLCHQPPLRILNAWDRQIHAHVPATLRAAREVCTEATLIPALDALHHLCLDLDGPRPIRSLLHALRQIYAGEARDPGQPSVRAEIAAMRSLADLVQDAARREADGRPVSLDLLLCVLGDVAIDPVRNGEQLDAEGWLELPWNPAPCLLLAGLHEGKVPAVRLSDPFLPDGFRQRLGLRSDATLYARDCFLLHGLLRSRAPGQVRVLCSRTDLTASPSLPSRLLFQTEDKNLLQRLGLLFHPVAAPRPRPPREPAFVLDLNVDRPQLDPAPQALRSLSVTAIRSYLACPTRFYLQQILRMESQDDTKREPDARDFGNWVHHVMEELVAAPSLRENPNASDWQTAASDAMADEIRRCHGSRPPLSVRVAAESARQRLHAACRVQADLVAQGWQTLRHETKLTRHHAGIDLVGRIDRIDWHPEHGIRVIDYKSSDKADPPAKAHLRPIRASTASALYATEKMEWCDLQLPLYRWLLHEQDLGHPFTRLQTGYFALPKALTETALLLWEEEEALQPSAIAALDFVLAQIQAGVFGPPASGLRYDDFGFLAEGFPELGVTGVPS